MLRPDISNISRVHVNVAREVSPQSTQSRPLHGKISNLKEQSQHSWEKFKTAFSKKNEITRFLKRGVLENPEQLATYFITVNPFSYNGHLLKNFLKTANPEFVKSMLTAAFEQYFENSEFNFNKILPFFQADQLRALIDGEQDINTKLAEMARWLPERTEIKQTIPSKISKTLQVVWRFFPNFLDTALKAFNLIDAGKNPETIWDFAAMLEIYYKIFMIPHALFMVIGTIVSAPLHAFLISAAVILALVIGTCLYLKYRPCPNKLPHAENFSQQAANGELDPVVSRDQEIQMVSSYLGRKKERIFTNLLLVGEPGVGKTELIKGVAQHYHEKKIFGLSAPVLSSGYSPILDVLRLIFLDIKGHENEVIFFLDELGDAIKKNPSANIGGYLKPLLGGRGVQIIAAVTREEYESQILTDDALASRFQVINILPTTREQTIAILQKRMEIKGKSVRFSHDLQNVIYELTEEKLQPRFSVQLLDLAINKVCAFDISTFVPKELLDAKIEFAQKKREYEIACNTPSERTSHLSEELRELETALQAMELENAQNISSAIKVKKLISKQRKLLRRRNDLARKQPLDNRELLYLNWILLPWIESKINATIDAIPPEIPMQIDRELIEGLINKEKEKEEEEEKEEFTL